VVPKVVQVKLPVATILLLLVLTALVKVMLIVCI